MTAITILNVDDSDANRYVKTRTLLQAGFRVVEASTGRAALDIAARERPELVLLDIKLPDIDGFEVCRSLKLSPGTARIPVIHISSTFVGEATRSESVDAGADIYLSEPIGPKELTTAVLTVLKLRVTERSLAESEERLRLASESAGIAPWQVDERGAVVWSAHFSALLGYGASHVPTLQSWLDRVRTSERAAVAQAIDTALKNASGLALECWIERADTGEARCLAAYASVRARETGVPAHLIGVAMDVTARKRTEADREALLAQARAGQQAAEGAARMKDEFLAILSHELRTPMSAVLGWLQLARSGRLNESKRDEALAIVERNARLQAQLISDLLDVSRIVSGKLELEDGIADVATALADAVESARPVASERGVDLQIRIEAGNWAVKGSAARLEQVFGNLLSNAIKFSPAGGRIDAQLARSGNEARASVRDQGSGIPPELLPRVFDPFLQADASRRRRHGGLGLGLAIARSLVDLHGGRITVDSEPGRGATFTVILPLLGAAAAVPAPAPRQRAAPDKLQGVRVMVVEDERDQLHLAVETLEQRGAEVIAASEPMQALAFAQQASPQVLVLDIGMPGIDGYELLGRLRSALGRGPGDPPALALSGFAAPSDAALAIAAGFQAHMPKPFDADDFCAVVAELAHTGRS